MDGLVGGLRLVGVLGPGPSDPLKTGPGLSASISPELHPDLDKTSVCMTVMCGRARSSNGGAAICAIER